MAVYRSDQAQLTFASESVQGADSEMIEGTTATGDTSLSGIEEAGSRSIVVASASNFTVGDMIRIGTVHGTASLIAIEHEVRRIEAIDGTTFLLDRPTAFYHAASEEVKEISAIGGDSVRNDKDKHITFIPGVYETVDTPDPEMSIEGRRFLSTQSKRNFSVAYPGQQTFTGSIPNIILLNGWPLRFPIGQVVSDPSDISGSATITINQTGLGAKKGDIFMTVSTSHGLNAGDYISIYDDGSLTKTKVEVRRIVAIINTNTLKLDYPLHFDHPHGAGVREIASGAYYTHVITETTDLDTVSWNVHMLPSDEDADKAFNRRYLGGMVGSATITAEEGGMLMMSWDTVEFQSMLHNQQNQTTVSTNLYNGSNPAANMPRFSLMQQIDKDDVNMGAQTVDAVNNGSGYPSTQPYYFSQGVIKFYEVEIARIRNFTLNINNNVEPRYYMSRQGNRSRGPYEIHEGARDYTMSATVTLPDASLDADTVHGSAVKTNATELFKQLLLEGDYGGTTQATARTGFTCTLQFTRGTNDYIYIDIPTSSTAGSPSSVTNAIDSQGMFINVAQHSITADNPFQVDIDCIFRALKITIQDSVPVYP